MSYLYSVHPVYPEIALSFLVVFWLSGCVVTKDDGNNKSKSYILLFVCPVSRGIHLELTPSQSTHSVLLALRKFIARFPSVQIIQSDNGSSFHKSEKEIRLAYDNIKDQRVQDFLAKSQIRWEFITDLAPKSGSYWERMVALVKKPLRKILSSITPNYRELDSLLAEIELCINLRPITTAPDNNDEMRAICPMDLMFGYHARSRFPDTSVLDLKKLDDEDAVIMTKSWRRTEGLLNGFWSRFQTEYIQQLRSAHEARPANSRPLSVGDICLLADKSPSRSFWPICKIVEIFGGRRTDGKPRSCLIKIGGKKKLVKRPISLSYPLGFGGSNDQTN